MTDPAPYLTPDEVKERVVGSDALNGIPDAQIALLVAEFEEIAEQYLGTAFRVRHVDAEPVTIRYGAQLLHYRPQDVTVTDEDDEESTPTVTVDGVLTWATYNGKTGTAEYDHGFSEPPAVVLSACAQYVRAATARTNGRQVENSISWSTPEGGQFRMSTPDFAAGRPTGFLTVDRLLNSTTRYRIPGVA